MSDQQFADLVLERHYAEAAYQADPSEANFVRLYEASSAHRRELRKRQDRNYVEKYPAVQFTREPDDGLL